MKTGKKSELAFIAVFLSFIFVFGIWVVLKEPDEISVSERRSLADKPSPSFSSVSDGSFFKAYEKYLPDQFPFREDFRRIKSSYLFYVLRQKDNHGIFIEDGSAAQISYPLSDKSVEVYLKRLNKINDDYFSGINVNVYNTVIPDKAYFLSEKAGCPSIDYNALENKIKKGAPGTYIGIFDTLDSDCYYKTDAHWAQEKIIQTADRVLSAMGASENKDTYIKDELSPFYGVYYGQSALPLEPDTVKTVGSPVIDSALLTRADKKTGNLEKGLIYKTENISADDPYDIFLEGASTVTVIDNQAVTNGKTLYLISDSFGRSLAPLLLSDYDRVVVFDIRYIRLSKAFEKVPLTEGSDVLIAYSIPAIDVSSNLQVG